MKLYRISSLSIILILIIGMCVTSCMKESSSSVLQSDEEVPAKYVPAPIVIPSDNLEWDDIRVREKSGLVIIKFNN